MNKISNKTEQNTTNKIDWESRHDAEGMTLTHSFTYPLLWLPTRHPILAASINMTFPPPNSAANAPHTPRFQSHTSAHVLTYLAPPLHVGPSSQQQLKTALVSILTCNHGRCIAILQIEDKSR